MVVGSLLTKNFLAYDKLWQVNWMNAMITLLKEVTIKDLEKRQQEKKEGKIKIMLKEKMYAF